MALEAATRILKSTAPGQFDVVADNIQKVGKDSLSGTSWLTKIKEEQDEFMCIGIDNPKGVEHHALASSLREKLKTYQDAVFGSKAGVTARVALVPGEEKSSLVVHTYAEKLDMSNQYTGAWKASWTVTSEGTDKAEISGMVRLHTFSYEDGNIQLRTNRDFEKTEVTAGDDLSESVMNKIKEWEAQVVSMLAELRDSVGDHLRPIRRVLPITKTKMKWDVVAHRNVKVLHKTSKPKKK